MEDLPVKYKCPECDRAVLNRRISHCLYCGATLPPDYMFSQEKMARLDAEEELREEMRKKSRPSPAVDRPTIIEEAIQNIEVAGNVAGLAADLIQGIGDLLD